MKTSRPRAQLATSGLLLALSSLLSAACAQSVDASGLCEDGLTICGASCVDAQIDPANCGSCGNACPSGGACEDGACVADCSAGLTNCNGSCVDVASSQDHCGSCGLACTDGATCTDGACVAPCPPELLACEGGCVDADSDRWNCGGCGVVCPPGDACVAGVCGACEGGQTKCGSQCVDLSTSNQHCGGCGLSCAPGFGCIDGQCTNTCPSGQVPCNGFCTDLQTSNQHCGACNDACAVGESCQAGACVCPGGLVCGFCAQALPAMVPQSVNGSTTGAPDGYAPTCAGSGSSDVAYSFTAPSDGHYSFDVTNSIYWAVVAVLDPSCVEAGCGELSGPMGGQAVVQLAQGETVVVVVDGLFGESGFYWLDIDDVPPPVCPTFDLGSTVPQMVTGTTLGTGDALSMSCSFGLSGDVSYTFTAPETKSYVFSTVGSLIDTALSVRDGSCSGPEIACNDNFSQTWESRVTVPMTQGQTVVVGVEGVSGQEGDFTLHVVEAPTPVCPTFDLGSTVPQVVAGSNVNTGDALTPSCNFGPSGDVSYTFTAPADGSYSFDTYGSAIDTILHLRDGSCAGPEIVCNDNGSGGSGWESFAWATLTAGQTVVVSVEGLLGQEGSYVLNVNSFVPPPCPMVVLPSTVPQTVSGDTSVGAVDFLAPTCTSSQNPEVTYAFTAPASGVYTFDTVGSSYDTVLYVRAATCAGPELACNDDTIGLQSEVQVQLAAGQTVIIAVDGFGSGSAGPFVLNVH